MAFCRKFSNSRTMAAALAVVMGLATMAAAQKWEEQVTKNKFGDVDGRVYSQTVTAEVKNDHPNVKSSKWILMIIDRGDNKVALAVAPSPSYLGLVEIMPVLISLRDENKNVQKFEGFTVPNSSSSSNLTIICENMDLAKAFDVNTKYKIVLEGVSAVGDNWSARADIVGNSPGAKMRAQLVNKMKIEAEEKRVQDSIRAEERKVQDSIRVEKDRVQEAINIVKRDRYDQSNYGYDLDYRGKRMSDPEYAISEFNEAIQMNPNYAEAYNIRGLSYAYKKDYDRAITDFNEAIRLNPNYGAAYNNMGMAYVKKGDYDKAIEYCDKAIQLAPEGKGAERPYFWKGSAYIGKNDYNTAIELFVKSLLLRPSGSGDVVEAFDLAKKQVLKEYLESFVPVKGGKYKHPKALCGNKKNRVCNFDMAKYDVSRSVWLAVMLWGYSSVYWAERGNFDIGGDFGSDDFVSQLNEFRRRGGLGLAYRIVTDWEWEYAIQSGYKFEGKSPSDGGIRLMLIGSK